MGTDNREDDTFHMFSGDAVDESQIMENEDKVMNNHPVLSQFDPLQGATGDKPKDDGNKEIDLMSQIAGWGSKNKTEDEPSFNDQAKDVPKAADPAKNVMNTTSGAAEISSALAMVSDEKKESH
jgi:hypothetical protein